MEQALEKKLATLVCDAIGKYPTEVSCTFVGRSDLAILIEDIKTPVEEFLDHYSSPKTLKRYRRGIERAIGNRVQQLVEETVERPIEQVSMSRQTETRWMGIFILL